MPDDKDFLDHATPVQPSQAATGQDFLANATAVQQSPAEQTAWQAATTPQDTGHPWADFFHNWGGRAAKTFAAPFQGPYQDTFKGIHQQVYGPSPYEQVKGQVKAYGQSQHPFTDVAGDLTANALQLGLFGAGQAGVQGVRDYYSPSSSPYQKFATTVGPEAKAQALRVDPKLTENLIAEHPSIAQFAQESASPLRPTPIESAFAEKSKVPFKTVEEYGQAAQRLKESLSSEFYDRLQKPFENDRLQVSPDVASYTPPGWNQPLGPYPTVAELNEALTKANQLSGSIHMESANAFEKAQAMAADHVARQLRPTLNEYLSSKSNMTPEEVGAFRERVGATGTVAENAASRAWANRLAQQKGVLQATSPRDFLIRAGQGLLGGPEAIANRQFRSALGNLPEGMAKPTPDIQITGAPGGITPPATFSPRATTVGPEPLPAPPVRYGPQQPVFNAPPVRFSQAEEPKFAAPPVRYSRPEEPTFNPPPVRYGPGQPEFAPPPVQFGPERPVFNAPPVQFRQAQEPKFAPPAVRYSRAGESKVAPPPVRYSRAGEPEAAPPSAQRAPTPDTHQFSASAWQKANPGGDLAAARRHAINQGFKVVP